MDVLRKPRTCDTISELYSTLFVCILGLPPWRTPLPQSLLGLDYVPLIRERGRAARALKSLLYFLHRKLMGIPKSNNSINTDFRRNVHSMKKELKWSILSVYINK